ncbi:hypothetical protein L218DRAFT_645723 [Marasmius fiardii PR-910]|nr:hypothetical protein L218DRAFT_645723 [Marasmius fiardii PR-910]
MQMFPAPQHPPQQHSPHMAPPMAPPIPPPSYEEDSAAQAAARGYMYYPPYYPGQVCHPLVHQVPLCHHHICNLCLILLVCPHQTRCMVLHLEWAKCHLAPTCLLLPHQQVILLHLMVQGPDRLCLLRLFPHMLMLILTIIIAHNFNMQFPIL